MSLLVRGINNRSTAGEIKEAFDKVGGVKDVYIPKDFRTGNSRGFAFVEMAR